MTEKQDNREGFEKVLETINKTFEKPSKEQIDTMFEKHQEQREKLMTKLKEITQDEDKDGIRFAFMTSDESRQDKREMDITEARKRHESRMRLEALKLAFDFSKSVILNNKIWDSLENDQKYEQLKTIYSLAGDNYRFIEEGEEI
jgi:hypothetical protein